MTILEILNHKIIPWTEQRGMQRFMVANDELDTATLPEGVWLAPAEVHGTRVAVKGPRSHGNQSNYVARWPEDELLELRAPLVQCIVSGRVDMQAGKHTISMVEGCTLLIPSRTPYAAGESGIPRGGGEIPDILTFSVWDNRMQVRLCHKNTPHFFVPSPTIVHLLDTLIEERLARRPGFEDIAAGLWLVFLKMVARELGEGNCFRQGVNVADSNPANSIDPIENVLRYIKSHLNQHLTIEAAATMALMSRAQFTKRFRQTTGRSFVEYLTMCRFEEAKMLLHETDWAINTICNFIGFRDATRLREIFHEHEGMSLNEYRRNSRLPVQRKKAVRKS